MTDDLPSVITTPLIPARQLPLTRSTLAAISRCKRTRATLHELLNAAPRPAATGQQWATYWQGRAEGTSLSRQHHARAQYVGYFDSALTLSLAANELTDVQLRPVTGVLDDPEWKKIDGKQILIESPACGSGALVFSIQDEETLVLYLPGRAAAFSSHATRVELEHHLPTSTEAIRYRPLDDVADGLGALLDDLLETEHQATLATPQIVFANPPDLLPEASDAAAPLSLFDMGSLGAEVSSLAGSRQVDIQMQLIEALSDTDAKQLEQLETDLQVQGEHARQAINALLQSPRWHSGAVVPPINPALIDAHRQSLRIHAQAQRLLGQITTAQLNAIERMLDQGELFPQAGSDVVAAYPLIKQQAHVESGDSAGEESLRQILLVTSQATLAATADGPFLLYWPGTQGGLLLCENHLALATCLGATAEHQSVELRQIKGDVLAQVLNATLIGVRAEKQQIQNDQGLDALATELPRLEEVLQQRLQPPRHTAREVALDLVREQDQVVSLATASATRLSQLPLDTCQALGHIVPQYIEAVKRSEALLSKDLLDCQAFCRPLIRQRLKQDFPGYDNSYIGLDVPLSVDLVNEIVTGGTPGTVTKKVYRPSRERETLSLETLLLENIDETMGRRLNYLKLQLATNDASLLHSMTTGVTRQYLETLTKDLDLAKAYETQILAAYQGLNDSPFVAEFRRECLTAPYASMLRMQGLLLRGKGTLDTQGLAILEIAIAASSRAAYQAQGHDIQLLAATLTAGGPDTENRPVALSGITFIEDRTSGITLLYLPEHSTTPLTQYASLEAARLSLYERSKQAGEADYLAGRALLGDPRAHSSRIRQAHTNAYSGIIGIGGAWPATTSLPEHLLKAQMGRVIRAHRATTRSNDELWLENFTQQSTMIFTYLKIVLGLVPFLGTAIGIYDFFDSAARAVNAFTQNKIIEGLEALNDVLLAVIDAAMDVATGVGVNVLTLRQLTRQRQLRTFRRTTPQRLQVEADALQRARRFAGYEHPQAITLDGMSPGAQGRYQGVYRHAEGDFVVIEHQPYQVEWDSTAHTWRLKGSATKTWKRAMALAQNGQWDTHFELYGVHLLGGGAGGGQIVGRLADQLDPYWPAAIRDQLPRFLVDQRYRQQRRVTSKAFAEESDLIASINRSNALAERSAPSAQLQASFLNDIRLAKQSHQSWDELLKLSARKDQLMPKTQKARSAKLICERLLNVIELRAIRGRGRLTEMAQLRAAMLPMEGLADQLPLLQQWRHKAIEHLKDRDELFKEMDELGTWFQKAERAPQLQASYERYQQHLNKDFKAFFDTLHLMPAALRHDNATVLAEYLLERLGEFEDGIHRTRNTLVGLHEVPVNAQQRRAIYEQARTSHEQYKRRLQSTHASFPALFDEAYLKRLYENLDALIAISDTQLRRLPRDQAAGGSSRSPRLFLDTAGHWHVGDYQPATTTRPAQIVLRRDDGTVLDRYAADGERWRQLPANARARPHELQDLKQVASQALSDLPTYRRQIQRYQGLGMLPVDVEHMMTIKAEDLERYANRLQQLQPTATEPARLRAEARTLRNEGRAMRIEQIKQGAQPNEAQLSYLIEQQQVELRRAGNRQMLKDRDYLQEYEVLDTRANGSPVLWFVHFHYRGLETPFEQFSAAHLKRAVDRYHGQQWQQGQPEHDAVWRGPVSRQIANTHFARL
ncbi:TPA: hypothetical protein QEM96_000278 [Pseudomonas putida]|nr:hypothetical protein [Pseudomonas putida]